MSNGTNPRNREHRTVYEVRRLREAAKGGAPRAPEVESFGGLDRARLAALGYALDGPTTTNDQFTGTVEIHRTVYIGGVEMKADLVDVLDERVAFRVLNELALPRAHQLAVSVERLQAETNRLARLGMD